MYFLIVQEAGNLRVSGWWAYILLACLLAVYFYGRERQHASGVSSYKGTNLIFRALSSWRHVTLITSKKAPSPDTVTLEVQTSMYEFGVDINIQSITLAFSDIIFTVKRIIERIKSSKKCPVCLWIYLSFFYLLK